MNEKYIELARKLKALADKGVGGEKTNAEKMLIDLMAKHKLTIADIDGEEIKEFFFNIKDEFNDLFYQIAKSVNRDMKIYRFPKKEVRQFRLKGNHEIKCTVAEYIEIEQSFDIYSRLYQEELKVFYSAFIHANNIYPEPKDGEIKSLDDFSIEELKELRRKLLMSENIKKANIRKQLNS